MIKHLQKLFALVLVCAAFIGSSNAWAQVQYEPFATTGSLTSMEGWANNSGTAGQLQVVSGNLTYNGLAAPAGNKVAITASGSEDARLLLSSPITSGSVYASFVMKPESAFLANSTVGNYFIHFTGQTATTFISRVSIRAGSTPNTFNIGVINYSGGTILPDAVYGTNPTDYPIGETYFVVFKYDMGANVSSVWVNPVPGADQPTATITSSINNPSASEISGVGIRQSNSSGAGTGNNEIDELRVGTTWAAVTPSGAPVTTPTITPSTGSIDFGSKLQGTTSIQSYTLTAANIAAGQNVELTATAPFLISTTEDGTYTSTLSIAGADLTTATRIYVKVSPTTVGELTGKIVHTATGATAAEVGLIVVGASAYAQDFNICSGELPGGWMQYSVTGAQTWACTTFGETGNGVQMNGYQGGNNANQDWLISPAMDLTGYTIPLLSFNYRTKFAGDAVEVKVSTNYTGSGDPAAATWVTLATLAADDADIWKLLEKIDLTAYKSATTHVAFVYTSTTESAARWTLDNFKVVGVEKYLSSVDRSYDFGIVGEWPLAAPLTFETFKAVGFTEPLVITAAQVDLTTQSHMDFEFSKTNLEGSYAKVLTYTVEELADGVDEKLYIRFKPESTYIRFIADITATSGDFKQVLGTVKGSSILKATTLDVVTWNVEWFGSTNGGPEDEALQYENAKKALVAMNADIIGVQEVVDEAKMEQLAKEIGYEYVSETQSWQASNEQKVGFIYNPAVVTVKKEKVLLAELFKQVTAGTTTIEYPVGQHLLWSNGRLPYMVEFEATIAGKKQLFHVINIHAKANDENPTEQYARRKADVKILKDSLDAQYANANIILLGDFNDDVDVSVVGTNNPSSFELFVTSNDFIPITYDLSTTGAVTYESSSFKSFLDHIVISTELEDEYIKESVAIESNLLNTIEDFRGTTSDHLPVSARFYLTTTAALPTIAFTQATLTKTEDAGTFDVSVTLSEAVATEQTITVSAATGGTASAADYTLANATEGAVTVTIPANATSATFAVTLVDDELVEEDEVVTFNLSNPSTGITLGTGTSFALTITDNDKSAVSFALAAQSMDEAAGSTTVTLNLNRATVKQEQIVLNVTNATGVTYGATGDYTTAPAVTNNTVTLTVPAAATSISFTVTLNDDAEVESAETITFALGTLSSGLIQGANTSYVLTINESDSPNGIADGTKGQFSVYPNPAAGATGVRLSLPERVAVQSKVNLVVYTLDGKSALNITGTVEDVQKKLNTESANLTNGMYIVLVQAGKEFFQTKLIKQ